MAATRSNFTFKRTKGFADCVPPHTCSSQLLQGGNPFHDFVKSTSEKPTEKSLLAGASSVSLSQLILLRPVQQHSDFGGEATSKYLFPP